MGVDAELDPKRVEKQGHAINYSTVRDHIDKELEAIQQTSDNGPIYEIHRRFESFASENVVSSLLIDKCAGFLLFLVFLIFYPFIAFGIKLTSRGPVLYKQRRTGKNGLQFTCYKFRTMQVINLRRIDGKPMITEKGDKRIFGFGNLLRCFSLDELPQAINILKGEMSLIGPRPYPVDECSFWNCTFDDFYYRYSTKPGITGLAQIHGYRGGTLDETHMRKRLDYDLIYTKKASLKLDMYILAKTFRKIIHPDANTH
jgi:lipopolysaccharide/colanic/teichoic acid biosynthesis glycosyltransferase